MRARVKVLTLGVSDLERSLAFYQDGLGLPTVNRHQELDSHDGKNWTVSGVISSHRLGRCCSA